MIDLDVTTFLHDIEPLHIPDIIVPDQSGYAINVTQLYLNSSTHDGTTVTVVEKTGITVTIHELAAVISMVVDARHIDWPHLPIHGTLDVTFKKNATLAMTVAVGRNETTDGVTASISDFSIDDFELHLKFRPAGIISLVLDLLRGLIDSAIRNDIPPLLMSKINPLISEQLSQLPSEIALSPDLVMDVTLAAAPVWDTTTGMTIVDSGAIHAVTTEACSLAAPTITPPRKHMLEIVVSDNLFECLEEALVDVGLLDIAEYWQNVDLDIQAPLSVAFNDGAIDVGIPVEIGVLRIPYGSEEVRQFLNFTLDLAMGVDIGVTHLATGAFSLTPKLRNATVDFNVTAVADDVPAWFREEIAERDDFAAFSLFIADAINALLPAINHDLSGGITIPQIPTVELTAIVITSTEHMFTVGIDYKSNVTAHGSSRQLGAGVSAVRSAVVDVLAQTRAAVETVRSGLFQIESLPELLGQLYLATLDHFGPAHEDL